MPNFKHYDYSQDTMIVINFEDQLLPNTFEYTLHQLIDNYIDLAAFNNTYNNDHGGQSAYDPAILLKIILFAYSKGITSSREIQWQCQNNIIFKALSCDTVPHFTSIASFVSSHPKAIESVFEQVVLVCDQQGLLGNELFAIDGCKMSSNAAKEHSGTLKELSQKRDKIRQKINYCLSEHVKLDGRKVADRERKGRLAQEAETLEKQFNKINDFLQSAEPRMGHAKKPKEVKSNITDNESGKMLTSKGTIQGYNGVGSADKLNQIVIDAQVFGEGQEHHTLKPVIESIRARYKRIGISDDIIADQVVITADTGFSNESNNKYLKSIGVNAYIPDNQFRSRDKKFDHQKVKYGKRHRDEFKNVKKIIPSSKFHFDQKDKTCICPNNEFMTLIGEERKDGKVKLLFQGRVSSCRGCPLINQCMRTPESASGREGKGRQVSKTFTNGRTPTDWMKRRVDSQLGKTIYSHRMSVIEPVFGNIGTNKGLNRFSLRGKEKVQGQWQLFCLVHNIEKLANYSDIGAAE